MDPQRLTAALLAVPADAWSLPSTFEATKVHHGYRRVVVVDARRWLPVAEAFRFVLEELAPVYEAWLSLIEPGGFIVPHRDGGPWRERWQVPIAPGSFTQGDTVHEPRAGQQFQVEHWLPHSVWNLTDRPRIHLVVDRDIVVDRAPAPFQTFPVPSEYQEVVHG